MGVPSGACLANHPERASVSPPTVGDRGRDLVFIGAGGIYRVAALLERLDIDTYLAAKEEKGRGIKKDRFIKPVFFAVCDHSAGYRSYQRVRFRCPAGNFFIITGSQQISIGNPAAATGDDIFHPQIVGSVLQVDAARRHERNLRVRAT